MSRASIIITSSIRKVVASWELDVSPGGTIVLPSSVRGDDPLADAVAERLRDVREGATAVDAPEAAAYRLRRRAAWRTVDLRALESSAELDRVTLPQPLVDADALIIACDLDRVADRGPYVLDLLATRAAFGTKVRLHARRGRIADAAELNLAVRIQGCVLALTVGGDRWYLATPDPIAGELAALALSEETRAEQSVVVPWEDPIVQRATELHLGVLLPADLALVIDEDIAGNPVADAIAQHLRRRLGLT